MEKEQVTFLSECMEEATSTLFDIKKLDTTVKNFLPGFQKGKEVISGFEVTKHGTDTSYLFTFINGGNENYYLVIYTSNKKAMAELKNIEVTDGNPHIVWKYNPAKRDGKNQERKDYFKANFGSIVRQVPIPKTSTEIESFLSQFFAICQNRLEADSLGEK